MNIRWFTSVVIAAFIFVLLFFKPCEICKNQITEDAQPEAFNFKLIKTNLLDVFDSKPICIHTDKNYFPEIPEIKLLPRLSEQEMRLGLYDWIESYDCLRSLKRKLRFKEKSNNSNEAFELLLKDLVYNKELKRNLCRQNVVRMTICVDDKVLDSSFYLYTNTVENGIPPNLYLYSNVWIRKKGNCVICWDKIIENNDLLSSLENKIAGIVYNSNLTKGIHRIKLITSFM